MAVRFLVKETQHALGSQGERLCQDTPSPNSVSLLLACHNGALWLRQLWSGLSSQTMQPSTLIICDDASTDATWPILQYLAKTTTCRVRLSHHERNMGVVSTFAELLTLVDTEYFCLSDQDDVWLPDKLEESVKLLESSGADLVYTDLTVVDENLHELAPSMWRQANIAPVSGPAVIPLLLRNSVTGCTVVARSQLLERALPFPDGIAMHDWWLALVAACGHGVEPLHEQTVLYRQHGGNTVGAVTFSVRGLRASLARRRLSLAAYCVTRVAWRLALVRGLDRRHLAHLPFLGWFYRLPAGLRLVLSPLYLGYTVARGHVLGLRSLLVDAGLTCFPFRGPP